jgi:hypothetical protein
MIITRLILLKTRNVSIGVVYTIQIPSLHLITISEIRVAYETMWKNAIQPNFACCTIKVCHSFRYQIKYLYKIPLPKLCQVNRIMGTRGGAVRWGTALQAGRCHWNFSFFIPAAHGPGVDSAPNRYEHQKYFMWGGGGDRGSRYVGLTTLPPSCINYLELQGLSTSWNPQGM